MIRRMNRTVKLAAVLSLKMALIVTHQLRNRKMLAASKVIFFRALNLNCSIALDFSPIKNVNR